MTSFLNSPFSSYLKGLLFFLFLVLAPLLEAFVYGQIELKDRIEKYQPKEQLYIKNKLIFGYEITNEKLEDLPKEIREGLGKVDQTVYSDEMLKKNQKSYIALQLRNDKEHDFYVIDQNHFQSCYQKVPLKETLQDNENQKLLESLLEIPSIKELVQAKNKKICGLLKTAKMKMIKMSDIGFLDSEQVVIKTPWGTQTKQIYSDAYLAYDHVNSIYYMVNTDALGNPINYIPM